MEKVIVPKGTKQDFSDIFTDLQNYIAVNFERRFNRLVDQSFGASYGIIMEHRNESFAGTETSFNTTITNTDGGAASNLTFTAGQAIVRNTTTNHIDYIRYVPLVKWLIKRSQARIAYVHEKPIQISYT